MDTEIAEDTVTSSIAADGSEMDGILAVGGNGLNGSYQADLSPFNGGGTNTPSNSYLPLLSEEMPYEDKGIHLNISNTKLTCPRNKKLSEPLWTW